MVEKDQIEWAIGSRELNLRNDGFRMRQNCIMPSSIVDWTG